MAAMFPLPTVPLRQTAEGSILIGSTQEEVGFDTGTNIAGAGRMAERACRILPALENVNVVRHWAGLRVMTPDGHPIYAQSPTYPGAFCTICHSGVTLAAAHAMDIASALMGDVLPDHLKPFHPDRFHVSPPT
jgi:glycine/D-amino acid oxidase-like deaminating enzyme